VDAFAVKYVGKENAHHLRNALLRNYEITTDWAGKVYSGMTLMSFICASVINHDITKVMGQ
jgi:hypothetical protein